VVSEAGRPLLGAAQEGVDRPHHRRQGFPCQGHPASAGTRSLPPWSSVNNCTSQSRYVSGRWTKECTGQKM
jgi:hypothetical protein